MDLLKRNLISIVVLAVLSTLAVQTYIGDHGLQARSAQKARILGLNKKLQLLHEQRRELERMTRLMAPGAADRDMLEFQARELLNFTYPKERIFVRKGQ